MKYIICFVSALIILILTIITAFTARKNNSKIAVIGIIPVITLLFYPVGDGTDFIEQINNIMAALFRAIRVLFLGEDYAIEIFDFGNLSPDFVNIYVCLLTILYLAAPMLTFSFILSFFKDIKENLKLNFLNKKDIYLFSCMNEYAVKTVKKIGKDGLYVFFNSAEYDILSDELKKYKCCFFKHDITSAKKSLISKSRRLNIYLNKDDENQNIADATKIIKRLSVLRNNEEISDTDLYVFTGQPAHELLLNAIPKNKVNLRILDINMMLAQYFLINDKDMAECFKGCIEGREYEISFLGFKKFNETLFKCIVWFLQCHEDKKVLKINIYTDDETAEQISEKYPELISDENLRDIPSCSVNIFSKYNPSEDNSSIIFVDCEDDTENINKSVRVSEKASGFRNTDTLRIKTPLHQQNIITYTANESETIHPVNHKNQKYPIDFLLYDNIFGTEKKEFAEVEKIAEKLYMSWNSKENGTLYDFGFDYRSSMSSAIFWYMYYKLICKNSVPENNDKNKRIEHKRWNAFMRSEGYIYSNQRNDIARMHNCLDKWESLPENVRAYDGLVIEIIGNIINDTDN